VETVALGEAVVFETVDALGGQVKDEGTPIDRIDWSRVNPATGPVFVENVRPGDTLVVKIRRIRVEPRSIIVAVPGYGVLGDAEFSPRLKILRIVDGVMLFEGVEIPLKPMIGTVGVAPDEGEVATGDLGRHGGNMDAAVVGEEATLYLPVFVEGALFALGDLHAVQGDGEVCVAAAEVGGEVEVVFDVIHGRRPEWPVVEYGDRIAVLVAGETLDSAAREATRVVVRGIMRRYCMDFAEAYMLASLVLDLRINQVVDPKKGIRAEVAKKFLDVHSLLG